MGLDMNLNLKKYKEGKTFEQHKKLLDLFWRYTEVTESKKHFENEVNISSAFGLGNDKAVLLVLDSDEYKEDFTCPLDEFIALGAVTYQNIKRKTIDLYQEGEIIPTSEDLEEYNIAGFITIDNDKEIRKLFYNRAQESLEYYNHHLQLIDKEISCLKESQDYEILLGLIKEWQNDFNLRGELVDSLNGLFIERECDEFMYWSKANHIHNWMVQNIQNGVDDCKEYHLSWEKSEKLIQDIKAVLTDNNLAEKLLPRTSGFFFGSDEYNERYYFELERTLERLETAREYKEEGYEMFYDSSW